MRVYEYTNKDYNSIRVQEYTGLGNWSSYEYEYDGACAMIVNVSVRTDLDSGIIMYMLSSILYYFTLIRL